MLDTVSDKPVTAIARIKQMQEEIARLSAVAQAEALSQAEAAVVTLNALGLPYRLVETSKTNSGTGRKRRRKQADCQVCGFATDPPHDARRHKAQDADRRPFNDEELTQLGLRRTP